MQTNMQTKDPESRSLEGHGYPNRLGVSGWLGGGRWGFERYLYTLHRVTGLGILLYFVAHIFVTASRASGPQAWARAMALVSGPVFSVGEYLVFAAFAIHGLNGIRLVAVELGFAVGKPIEPVYPYRTSVGRQRPLAVVLMILAAAFMVAGGYNFITAR
jgi:succinate dehydrogenase / fumarate reductase, cytochrome b subunit